MSFIITYDKLVLRYTHIPVFPCCNSSYCTKFIYKYVYIWTLQTPFAKLDSNILLTAHSFLRNVRSVASLSIISQCYTGYCLTLSSKASHEAHFTVQSAAPAWPMGKIIIHDAHGTLVMCALPTEAYASFPPSK